MENTKEKIYINFESNEKYYQVKLLSIENKEITISKNKPLKNILEQYKKRDINFYNTWLIDKIHFINDIIYQNEDFILLTNNEDFILYNLQNDKYYDFELAWWVNDINDFEMFIISKLQNYNIKYDNDIINNIIVNFENMNK